MSEESTPTDTVDEDGLTGETRDLLNQAIGRATEPEGAPEPEAVAEPGPTEGPAEGGEQPEDRQLPQVQLDPVLARAKAEEDRLRELREQHKEELEAANAYRERIASMSADRVGALRAIIADSLGEGADDSAVESELAALYEELTSHTLGLKVDSPEGRLQREQGKLRAELAALKRKEQAAERKRQAEAKQAEARKQYATQVEEFQAAISQLDDVPYLAAHQSPGEVLYSVAHSLLAAGEDVTIADAAKIANQKLEEEVTGLYSRFQTLLTPQAAEQAKKIQPARTASRTEPRTLTNDLAAQQPTSAPKPVEYDGDDEAWEAHTLSLLRQRLKQ